MDPAATRASATPPATIDDFARGFPDVEGASVAVVPKRPVADGARLS